MNPFVAQSLQLEVRAAKQTALRVNREKLEPVACQHRRFGVDGVASTDSSPLG